MDTEIANETMAMIMASTMTVPNSEGSGNTGGGILENKIMVREIV